MAGQGELLVLEGCPAVEVRLRRSPRARRLSLRVSRLDGRVTLSMPRSLRVEEALAFLHDKSEWVRGLLADRPEALTPGPGDLIPVEGRMLPVVAGAARGPRLLAECLSVRPAQPAAPQVAAILKWLARARLAAASDRHSAALGHRYAKLTLRDTRSRWGSCTSAGGLMYSWRLAMAPAEVLDYVAAHEVAHLVEMNHAPAFWQIVSKLCPDYAQHRKWLRDHGAALHRYRFDP